MFKLAFVSYENVKFKKKVSIERNILCYFYCENVLEGVNIHQHKTHFSNTPQKTL